MTPQIKIEIIQRSFKCFVMGVLGVIPLLGLPLAVAALGHNRRINQLRAGTWHPACRYQFWGVVGARMGIVLLFLAGTAAMAYLTMLNYWPTYN